MNKNFTFIFGIFIALISFSCSQNDTDKKEITETYKGFSQAYKAGNVDKLIDLMHPRIFEFTSKDTMKLALKELSSNTMAKIISDSLESISEVYKYEGIKYALVQSSQVLTMDIHQMKGEGGAGFAINLTLNKLREEHGKENVMFDSEAYVITIKEQGKMFAIQDPKYSGWKFLSDEKETMDITRKIVPEEVIKKF